MALHSEADLDDPEVTFQIFLGEFGRKHQFGRASFFLERWFEAVAMRTPRITWRITPSSAQPHFIAGGAHPRLENLSPCRRETAHIRYSGRMPGTNGLAKKAKPQRNLVPLWLVVRL